MTRAKKPGGKLNRGPFDWKMIVAAIERFGGVRHPSKEHSQCYKLPSGHKIPVSTAWTGIRAGDRVFNSIKQTMGISTKEFLRLLNSREL